MTQKNYEACIIMARSFINEFIVSNELKRSKHSELFELNTKLKLKVFELGTTQKIIESKAERSSAFVLDKLQKYVVEMNKDKDVEDTNEVEANNLIFGLNFIFILLEENAFKGHDKLYFKRISNDLYNRAEKHASKIAVHNANELIKRFHDEITLENV